MNWQVIPIYCEACTNKAHAIQVVHPEDPMVSAAQLPGDWCVFNYWDARGHACGPACAEKAILMMRGRPESA